MTVRVVKVIYCDEGRKGRGVIEDVVRRIPSLYTLDGQLICSFDCGPKHDGEVMFASDRALTSLGEG